MKLSYDKITLDLDKGKVAPSYFLYGDEEFLIDELLKKIIAVAVEEGAEDFNLDVMYGDETDGGKIINIAMSYPMMANRRALVVKGIHHLSQQSLALVDKSLDKPSPTTCLVMTSPRVDLRKKGFAQINKKSNSFEAKPLYENQIPDWIRKFVAGKGFSISAQAIQLLQVSAGNMLRSLVGEIEKVLLNIGERKNIEVDDVEAVVGVSKQYNVFELCDTVGRRDIIKGLQILNHMLWSGESPTAIVAMLTRHFTIIAKIKRNAGKDQKGEQIAADVGVHPFFLQNYVQQANNFTIEDINDAFAHLLDADIKLKSSTQKPQIVLEILLFLLITKAHIETGF